VRRGDKEERREEREGQRHEEEEDGEQEEGECNGGQERLEGQAWAQHVSEILGNPAPYSAARTEPKGLVAAHEERKGAATGGVSIQALQVECPLLEARLGDADLGAGAAQRPRLCAGGRAEVVQGSEGGHTGGRGSRRPRGRGGGGWRGAGKREGGCARRRGRCGGGGGRG